MTALLQVDTAQLNVDESVQHSGLLPITPLLTRRAHPALYLYDIPEGFGYHH